MSNAIVAAPADAEPPKRGRPTLYSAELAEIICNRIANGESVRQLCRDDAMPSRGAILGWLKIHPDFVGQYARACELRREHWEDEIIEIADDGSNDWIDRETARGTTITVIDREAVARSQIRIDARKWLMGKQDPKKYGERTRLEHTGEDGGPIQVEDARDRNIAAIETLSERLAGPAPGATPEAGAGEADPEPEPGSDP